MQKETSAPKRGLWAIMLPVKHYIQAAMGLSVVGGISALAGMVLLAYTLSIAGGGSLSFGGITLRFQQALIPLTAIVILSFIMKYYGTILSHLGAFRLEEHLRTQITSHLARVPLGYVISTGTGALKKVLLDDVKNLHAFVADSTPMIAKSIATPAASLVALLFLDVRLALVALGILLLGAAVMYLAMKDDTQRREKYEQSQSDINKAVIEFVQAMPVVRTYDDGTTSFKRYHQALDRYRVYLKAWIAATSTSSRISMLILSPMPTLIAVTVTGILWIANGSLTFPAFFATLLLSTGMADALMPLMWASEFIKKSQAAAIRIQEILALPALNTVSASQKPTSFNVVFDNVSFQYNSDDPYALKHISLRVPQNTTTALVGPSGAGKSTVAKLIPRFWDVTDGSIRIGGVDIRDMDTATLMNTVSFVFQDTFLFNVTLRNNIKIANDKATDEEMIQAAKAAQIHDFIMTLPNQYETMAGDRGTSLSGGQKQRITIARAILRNAPIVVLDEATAFADPENEEEIIRALSNLMQNKTIIVIAHRLSTIQNVEQIVVFDQGKIAESGRHCELLQKRGLYAALWGNFEKAQNWDLHSKGDA